MECVSRGVVRLNWNDITHLPLRNVLQWFPSSLARPFLLVSMSEELIWVIVIGRSVRGQHRGSARGVPSRGVDAGDEETGRAGGTGPAFRGVCSIGGRHWVGFILNS